MALTGLPIGYSVIVALTGLPIGYSVIVTLTGLPIGYSIVIGLTCALFFNEITNRSPYSISNNTSNSSSIPFRTHLV